MMRTGLQRIEENVEFLKSVPLLKKLSWDVLCKIADVLELVSIVQTSKHTHTNFLFHDTVLYFVCHLRHISRLSTATTNYVKMCLHVYPHN